KMDYPLDLTGFSTDDIQELLQTDVEPGCMDPDFVPEPLDAAQTHMGDLWCLSHHRLLCGDPSREQDVDRLLQGLPVHQVNTDLPYNVRVELRSNTAIAVSNSSF